MVHHELHKLYLFIFAEHGCKSCHLLKRPKTSALSGAVRQSTLQLLGSANDVSVALRRRSDDFKQTIKILRNFTLVQALYQVLYGVCLCDLIETRRALSLKRRDDGYLFIRARLLVRSELDDSC